MKIVTTAQMRQLDRRTIEEAGVPAYELMDRAGRGVADVIRYLADLAGMGAPAALIIAGRGNNGGDAFAAGRHLRELGFEVVVWIAGPESQIGGESLKHLANLRAEGVTIEEFPTQEDWQENLARPLATDFIVDGLLGIGSHGAPRGAVAWAIEYINTAANDAYVVSIDVPSGLNSDRGVAEGAAVTADVTVTMGLPKIGLLAPAALEFVGTIEVVDIGIPPAFIEETPAVSDLEMIYSTELRHVIPRRARGSHKGTYGHLLLIGGARGYAGAIALACRAAARSGVGLTTALVPASIATIVAGASLETMVHPGAETEIGSLRADALDPWWSRLDQFDAVLVGPGLTTHGESAILVRRLLERCPTPLVLDADALNVMAGDAAAIRSARSSVVVTPHPGEIGRLLQMDVARVQADRISAAQAAAALTGAVTVLKGAGTIVTAAEPPAYINMTGNPGMARGGSGDVLAGLLAGLLAQGIAPLDAARAAVFLHGRAGDMAAWRSSQTGMVAGDVVTEIPFAFRELVLR
ncbi:MAG: NAD(P)H-hydrate dehydratase [Kiritimatiellae bacterium]|nr:NAD(P)H-hydrate dehydratase [Kiritimatiellia bacterium]